MTSLKGFESFPKLPPEIRHKIYRDAFPTRVLQLGIDFPHPKLRHPDANNLYENLYSNICPTPTYLPALFHTCHESRILCLETYIPFAYSYMHPSLDTLYISRRIGMTLSGNPPENQIHALLYPFALLDRVAVQFDTVDTNKFGDGSYFDADRMRALDNVLELMGSYGVPKELLLVRDNDEWTRTSDEPWSFDKMLGFRSLDIVELDSGKPYGFIAVAKMLEVVETRLARCRNSSGGWWRASRKLRIPKVLRGSAVREGEYLGMDDNSRLEVGPRLLKAGKRVAREWLDEIPEQSILNHTMPRILYADGNPAYPENLNKALARSGRERWMLDLSTLHGLAPTSPNHNT
jgi:hypothetical protein